MTKIDPKLLKLLSLFESNNVNFIVGDTTSPSLIKASEGMLLMNPLEYTDVELPNIVK